MLVLHSLLINAAYMAHHTALTHVDYLHLLLLENVKLNSVNLSDASDVLVITRDLNVKRSQLVKSVVELHITL